VPIARTYLALQTPFAGTEVSMTHARMIDAPRKHLVRPLTAFQTFLVWFTSKASSLAYRIGDAPCRPDRVKTGNGPDRLEALSEVLITNRLSTPRERE